MSLFITFEGIEGCGKTTQIHHLTAYLQRSQRPHLVTREPGGTPAGEQIRQILLSSPNTPLEPMVELLLFVAARAQHLQEVIRPALQAGKTVICDRFTDATLAYQGFGRGLDLEWIEEIQNRVMGSIKPDLTFLLDLPVEEGLRRARSRVEKNKVGRSKKLAVDNGQMEFRLHLTHVDQDRLERKSLDFHRRVRDGYLGLAQRDPQRIIVLDGMKDEEVLHQEILDRLLLEL
jgi:dTMP kinase